MKRDTLKLFIESRWNEVTLKVLTEVINLIDFDVERLHDIVVDEFKILVRQPVLDISFSSSEEIIDNDEFMALDHQLVDKMGAYKSGTSCN